MRNYPFFLANPVIEIASSDIQVKQTDEVIIVKLKRTKQMIGKVLVPWRLVTETPDSVYSYVKGEVVIEDSHQDGEIIIKLPQVPLPQKEEKFTVQLEKPKGFAASLGDNVTCNVHIQNDFGKSTSSYLSSHILFVPYIVRF